MKNNTWQYGSDIVYKNSKSQFINFPDGRLINNNGTWTKEFDYKDHLGSTWQTFSAESNRLQSTGFTAFDPTGIELFGLIQEQNPPFRFKHQGKENVNDFGLRGLEDFGARWVDKLANRWWGVDALADKMPDWSPYSVNFGNNLRFMDMDGNAPSDIVTFNMQGREIARIKSNTEFRTFVQKSDGSRIEAKMPGVISGFEAPKYQKLDYQIAASTAIMNENLDSKTNLPATEGHQFTQDSNTPDLDVNLIKSIVMEESKMGTDNGQTRTGVSDPMQSNVPGDYDGSKDIKQAVGLEKGQNMTPSISISAGIGILLIKGMTSNSKGNYTNWKGNKEAVKNYNGGGNKNYTQEVYNYFNSIKPANSTNYEN